MTPTTNFLNDLNHRERATKTLRGIPHAWRTRRKIAKLQRNGWVMQGAPAPTGPWNRTVVYVFTRPRVSKAEMALLGWKK